MPLQSASGRTELIGVIGSVTIGTSAGQITTAATQNPKGIALKADENNTSPIYVGFANTVTAASGTLATAAATDGWPLYAGEEVSIPVEYADKVYAISGAAGQRVFVLRV